MSREYDVVIEQDDAGYFVASVPTIPGCHTQAKALDQLLERVREAIALCLEAENGTDCPRDSLCFRTRKGRR